MDQNRQQLRAPAPTSAVRTEQVLERYYGQLVAWGTLLTRGDEGKARDLVHDFCLHFSVTNPDLSGVSNLDGYLYKSLRNIYLSGLAQSSREALQLVNIAEFDSIQFALVPRQPSDPVQRQNDLRRICCYSVWRKAQTKGASYFILRYFHGYHHQEIAELACTNVAAIYSKFRRFRIEALSFLEEPGKLQFTSRELPPTPALHWTPLSSVDLFKELRNTILSARTGACLPKEELIGLYSSEWRRPISCSLLSHIVSCERCLALVDSHLQRPTLKDREPLDEIGDISGGAGTEAGKPAKMSRERLLRSVRRYRTEVLEHRPRTLSIAVDGKILASHDVEAQRNVLSARIERPEKASFVEVFSEQGIRLALISIGELPPEGPHGQTQRVDLSDNRWLDLSLSFDGLGLNSEVVYFDPALAPELMEEDDSDELVRVLSRPQSNRTGDGNILSWPRASTWLVTIRRFLRPVTPSPMIAWSMVIACAFCVAGYFVLRNDKAVPVLNASEVLNQSIRVEAANLEGQTEHQIFRFEEATADGSILKQGTIDLWKDGDGKRSMRRLYDARHRLIAAEWAQRDGNRGEYPQAGDSQPSSADRELLAGNLWKQDVSPRAFRELNGGAAQVRATEDGYELTAVEPSASHSQLISATLVLDRHYHPVREVMRMRSGGDVHEIRFVQADYERRPSSSVPDAIFDPQDQGLRSRAERHSVFSKSTASDVLLTELHVAVLYQLNSLNADTSDPIEVEKTSDGHIRVVGMVADDDRKQEIESRLSLLDNHQLLETQLVSPNDVREYGKKSLRPLTGAVSMYDVGQTKSPADTLLRTYFQGQGLSQGPLEAAVSGFSREALGHSQRALQNASALKRLSNTFSPSELGSVSPTAQRQWAEMVAKHATALEVELRALREQLSRLSPSPEQLPSANATGDLIGTPAQFERAADQLLTDTKSLDQSVSGVFASSQLPDGHPADIQLLITATSNAIPLQKTVEMTSFAVQLNASGRTAATNRQHSRPETQTPNRP
jgi:DNA-directed RNA polymerase specialized sigma24 family protein